MATFGQLLKGARTEKRKKLRDIAEATGLSISFISDIECGRKRVSNLDVVKKIEKFLGLASGMLLKKAEEEMNMGSEVRSLIKKRPALSLSLLRVTEGFTDDELSDLVLKLREGKGREEI